MNALEKCPVCGAKVLKSYTKIAAQMHHTKEAFNFDRCNNCELIMLNPRLPAEELNQYYTNHYMPYKGSSAWGKYSALVERSQIKLDADRVRILNGLNQINRSTLILDVGCGKPTFLKKASDKYRARGLGIDFSDKGWTNNPIFDELDLRKLTVEQLSRTQLKYLPDFITMWHYLEHDYFPQNTLSQLASIAKPETKLIIEVPNFNSQSRKTYKDNWGGWHTPRHTFLYSPKNLKILINNNGWNLQTLKTSGTLSDYLLYWISEMELKQINWSKDLEGEFWNYVWGIIKFKCKQFFKQPLSHGVMLVVATPKSSN